MVHFEQFLVGEKGKARCFGQVKSSSHRRIVIEVGGKKRVAEGTAPKRILGESEKLLERVWSV